MKVTQNMFSISTIDLPPRFTLTSTITVTMSFTYLLGEYVRTMQMFNGFPVYKLEGSAYYFFYSLTGYWTVDPVVGGPGLLSSGLAWTRVPQATGWRYYQDGNWVTESSLTWRAG